MKQGKILTISLIILVSFFFNFNAVQAGWLDKPGQKSLEKAEDLLSLGLKKEAQKMINQAVMENPIDRDFLIKAAKLYYYVGDIDRAENILFALYKRGDEKEKKEISQIFTDFTIKVLNTNTDGHYFSLNDLAARTLRNAVKTAKNGREKINLVMNLAKKWLRQGKVNKADFAFRVVSIVDRKKEEEIALIYKKAFDATEKPGIIYCYKAKQYSAKYNSYFAAIIYGLYLSTDNAKQKTALKSALKDFVTYTQWRRLIKIRPDSYLYCKGSQVFGLSAAHDMDVWIMPEKGKKVVEFRGLYSKNHFSFVSLDGRIYQRNKVKLADIHWPIKLLPPKKGDDIVVIKIE